MTIDDHEFFSDENIKEHGRNYLLIDYVLFCLANILFVMATVTSLNLELSFKLFFAGLVVSSVWALFQRFRNRLPANTQSSTEQSFPVSFWILINTYYGILIFWSFTGQWSTLGGKFWIPMGLLLVVDFYFSKTYKNMPFPSEPKSIDNIYNNSK